MDDAKSRTLTDSGAVPERELPIAGATLAGRYRLDRELGRGGMGQVFAAHDQRLDRDVAVKLLLGGAHDERRLVRFEQEARAAGGINHPNIVTVHDVVATDGGPCIVSELLEGETLRDLLARGPLPAGRAVDLARQLAEGLIAAHDRGVVHRDLKPANLFVTREGRLKIFDFGIAKLLEPVGDGPRTEGGAELGTVGYMAPEQIRGEPADARSDLFGAGVIFYESSADVYDPASDTWAPIASMNLIRYSVGGALGADGRIYAIGGWVGGDSASVEAYDPSTDTWSFAAPMSSGRDGFAAVLGPDGRTYAIGGASLSSVEAYTP